MLLPEESVMVNREIVEEKQNVLDRDVEEDDEEEEEGEEETR